MSPARPIPDDLGADDLVGAVRPGAAARAARGARAHRVARAGRGARAVRTAAARRRDRLGRLASGVAVLGTVAAVAVLGSGLPAPAAAPVADAEVRVPPGPTDLVCPGPVSVPEPTTAGDAAFDPTPVRTETALRVATAAVGPGTAGPATLVPLGGGDPLLELAGDGGAQADALGEVPGPTLLRVEPVGGEAPLAGGASASVTTEGDLRGLAAATCQEPSASIWLVGGSTEIGNSALLVVTNPGRTAAEVSLEVWGPSGPVEDLGGATFLVAPGDERALLLEGVAAEQRRLTVHVTAAGGLVSAHLQDSRLDGFTPAGVDLVTAGAAPATRQVVGGLVVQPSETAEEDAAQLRLLAPGDEDAVAGLTLLGADGPVTLPGAEEVALVAGEVTDVSLAGLPAGSYTAVVDADLPVVAGAMLVRPGPPVELGDIPTLERAWVAAREPGASGVVALPEGLDANLVVGAVGGVGEAGADAAAAGVLRALGQDGQVLAEQALSIPAGTTERILVRRLGGGEDVAAIQLLPEVGQDAAGATTDTADPADSSDPVDGADPADPATRPELAWWVLSTVGGGDAQLVSVLSPVPRADPSPSVEVRQGARLGLP